MKENFTQVPNKILDDETLSWDEKGVMATFFRNKRDWKAYKDEFIQRSKDGKTVINRIFKSLEEKGLIDKQIEGGVRLKNGRFTPMETFYQLSALSISLLDGTIENSAKSTVSRQPNAGYLKPLTENPLSATNKTNYNNSNNNKTKENKTNSVSESGIANISEIEADKTDTETEIDFLFVEGIEWDKEKAVSPSIEENSLEIESNRLVAHSRTAEDLQAKETTPTSVSNEGKPVSTKKVEGIQSKEKQPSSKYFFNYGEKPSLDKITIYAKQKGYSTETAYEVFNVLVDNDYCDSGGNQILSIETYINTMLSQKKKELKPDTMKELRAISDRYADLYASELEEDRYGVTTHRSNMWDFVKYYLSTRDNDTDSIKGLLQVASKRPVGKKLSSYKLKAMAQDGLKKRALQANADSSGIEG